MKPEAVLLPLLKRSGGTCARGFRQSGCQIVAGSWVLCSGGACGAKISVKLMKSCPQVLTLTVRIASIQVRSGRERGCPFPHASVLWPSRS